MNTKSQTKTRLSVAALFAGTLVGVPLTSARADEPMTADQAEAAAQAARARADHYRELGGTAYKTGLVQSAEAEATRYASMAQTLAPTPTVTEQRLATDNYQKEEEHLQALGGAAYKSSIGEQAQAKVRAAEQMGEQVQTPNPSCQPTKPAADLLCKQQQR
jgi:hypothetical protein